MTNNKIKNLIKKKDWQIAVTAGDTTLNFENWFTEKYLEHLEEENKQLQAEIKSMKHQLHFKRWIG